MDAAPSAVFVGIWALFALTSALSVILADGDEPIRALKLALTLGWMLLALREVRRYRAQRRRDGLEPS